MSLITMRIIVYTSSRGTLYFFFSSRRRHTSCLSDWSSDVCSSDLRTLHRMEFRVFFQGAHRAGEVDRKSTRLNSSHLGISYAVFCLKKKKKKYITALEIIYTTLI